MSGHYVDLSPGRYTLAVSAGEGPAGVHRGSGPDVVVAVDGGRSDFVVEEDERVYFWWRGPRERPGVRLLGVSRGRGADPAPETGVEPWPTGTEG